MTPGKHHRPPLWRRWHKLVLASSLAVAATVVLTATPAPYAQAGKLGDVGQVLEQGGQPAGKDDGESATAGPGADLPAFPSSLPALSTDLRTPVHTSHVAAAVRKTAPSTASATTSAQAPPAPRGGLLCDLLDLVGGLL